MLSSQSLLMCLFVAFLGSCQQFSLNVPQVLLPYVPDQSGVKTSYNLTSRNGCFKWFSNKPDVAMVTPLCEPSSQECCEQALVTSMWGKRRREKAIIIAEEQTTGTVLRCDVFVDTIKTIEITTTTREMLLGEVPELFAVRAFDEEGNIFSTLRGLVFEWTLSKTTAINQKLEPEDVLRFVPYTFDPVIEQIEQQGFHGDSVMVQGINAGRVVVHVKLQNTAWQNVPSDSVQLIIKENMMLKPNWPVFIIPLSYVDYTVWRRKQGWVEAVPFPSHQYSFQLSNTSVCYLNKTCVIGQGHGHTRLLLTDINSPSDCSVSTEISVVHPHHLGFHVTGDSWVLEVGQLYAITVQLFDHENHSLFMSENLRLDTVIPSEFFDIIDTSLNGSYFYIRPKKSGHPSFFSSFNKLVHPDNGSIVTFSSTLTQQQPMVIYGPVVVEVNPVVILWYAAAAEGESRAGRETYSYQLQVFGGSGSYHWSIVENNGIISVSSVGVVTILAQGSSSVKVTDQKNSHHFVIIKVYVAPPERLQFVHSTFEATVGTALILPIQIRAFVDESQQTLYPVVDCRKLNFNLSTAGQINIFNISMDMEVELLSLPKGACGAVRVVMAKVGIAKVTITLESKTFGTLETTAHLYASDPCPACNCRSDVICKEFISLMLPVLVVLSVGAFSYLLAILGMNRLQMKLSVLEQLIVNFRLSWDVSHNLDEILQWLATRKAQYGAWFTTTPTQDLRIGIQCLREMKRLAQDLSDKVKDKEKALAEAQLVLQQAGPKRRKEVSKKVDAVVSAWTGLEKDCKKVTTIVQEYLPELESLWHNIGDCERPLDDADRKGNAAMQFEQVDGAEQHEVIMKMIANVLSDVSKLVKTIRPQWERLAESHPSLKEVVPSILDPSASPAFDAEGRIKAIEERLRRLQSLQEFLKNLDNVLEWFQRARDATIPKARATFSLLSLMEQLQELYDFQQTLAEKQEAIPPLLDKAQLLSQSNMTLPLLHLSSEVEAKCTSRKEFLEDLTGRWRAFLATAQALLDWTKEMRRRFSEVIDDKDSFGVEDHLTTCKDFTKSITNKVFEFGQFQGVAASFETEVRGEGWDSGMVTAKNAEVQQSSVSLSDFIDEAQAKLQAVADKHKDLLHIFKEEQAWLKDLSRRCVKWQPCLGDVSVLRSKLDMAEGLLAEAHTHDNAVERLTDRVDFVVEHSRQRERKQVKEAIQDVCHRHDDLKQHLQDKVSQCQNALPLWLSFAATSTDLTSWMKRIEKLLPSPPMLPSLNSDEMNEMVVRVKSVQSELVHGKMRLQQLQSLEVDLTKACDMEEDKMYIAKKCADLRAQYNQLVKMAEAALAICSICERLMEVQHYMQRHRSLPSPSALSGPELEKRRKGLLEDSKSLVKQTQTALKNLQNAVEAAQKCGATVFPKIKQAVDTVTADAEQLPAAAQSWGEELTSRYSAWTQFREGLEQYIQSSTDLHTRVENEIDAQPIEVFVKDLDAFKKKLKAMVSLTQAIQKILPPIQERVDAFLFGDNQLVIKLRDAFTSAIQQQEETAAHLDAYLNRVASWEEYFDLLNTALEWFHPFKRVAEKDIDKFKEDKSEQKPSVVKLKEHFLAMDAKCGMVYRIRDFHLPILQSERNSVLEIVEQRDVFVETFEQLRKRLIECLSPYPYCSCFHRKLFLLLLGLGIGLGLGFTLSRKHLFQSHAPLRISIPAPFLAMDTTYIWEYLKEDISIGL